MNAFDLLDTYLARDFNPDHWYDDAHRFAVQQIAAFTSADWAALVVQTPKRPFAWQRRCAYVLAGSSSAHSAELLLQLAASDDDGAAWTAVCALDTLRWGTQHPVLTPGLEQRLDRLAASNAMASSAVDALRRRAGDGSLSPRSAAAP